MKQGTLLYLSQYLIFFYQMTNRFKKMKMAFFICKEDMCAFFCHIESFIYSVV
jgi:hypothetical protein